MSASVAPSVAESYVPDYDKQILIDIVSGRDLLPANSNGLSNPYVSILFGGRVVHKTDHIENTTNPVFSDVKKNTYVLKKTTKEMLRKQVIQLVVKDHNDVPFSSDDILGTAFVDVNDVYAAEGEDMELKLELPKWKPSVFDMPHAFKAGQDRGDAGYLTIRIREATVGDKEVISAERSIFKKIPTVSPLKGARERASVDGETFADIDEKILLVEILSCRDLLATGNGDRCNPYVKIFLEHDEIHKTDRVKKKTVNPNYGEKERNRFLLDCSISKLFGSKGIKVMVKDYSLGPSANEELGSVQISAESLYECKEQEYHLNSPPGKKEDAGYVTVRCSEITEEERVEFKKANKSVMDISMKPPIPGIFSSSKRGLDGPSDYSMIIEIVACQGLNTGKDLSVLNPIGAIGAIGGVAVDGVKAVGGAALSVVNKATKTVGVGSVKIKDPDGIYVLAESGGVEVHRTDKIDKTESPIYDLKTDGVFIFDVMKQDFLDKNEGLTFRVFDWDPLADKNLGNVTITAEELLQLKGERKVYKLEEPENDSLLNPLGAIGAIGGLATGGAKAVGGAALGGVKAVGGGISKVGKGVTSGMSKVTPKPLANVGKVAGKAAGKGIGAIGKVAEKGKDTVGKGVSTVGKGAKAVGSAAKSTASKANPLKFLQKEVETSWGSITIRCREATSYDRKFMKFLDDQKGDFLGCRQNTEVVFQTKGGGLDFFGGKTSIQEKSGPDAGVVKYLVRPEPDPLRVGETTYLSKEGLTEEAMKPSREWLHLGSGTAGRVFVELIGADGLAASMLGKNDPFGLLIFEDSYGKTDIINNCESPKWMHWSRRAFIFNMDHSSSDLRVGIFDYDKMGNHDMLGRAVVQVNRLKPDTEYVLKYNLYEDTSTVEREAVGTVTLRLRVEYESPKQVVLSALKMADDQYVNFQEDRQLHIARQVVEGKTDMVSYSIGTLTVHVGELTSYLGVMYYIKEAIMALLLWRGRPPINSAIAFLMAVTFVERPTLCFSYFFFTNAWLLLATQNWRNNDKPHVWNKTKPFLSIMKMLVLNKAGGPEDIPAQLLYKESVEYDQYWVDKVQRAERLAAENAALAAAQSQETAHLDTVGETDMSTKKNNLSDMASPFKSILYPLQQVLATVCVYLRIVRNIYLWDETFIAALLTAGSLAIGVVFFFLPWNFILRWVGRIVAWGVFGPHMKLVDVFYVSKQPVLTEEEEVAKLQEYYKSLSESANKQAELARIRTEDAIKNRAMKQLLFGKYVIKVPILKDERILDMPLPESYARPYVPPEEEPTILRLGGQGLVGSIIPELKHIRNLKEEKAKKDSGEEKKEEQVKNEKTPLLPH